MQSRLFASGFRPTFLVAGVAAASLIPVWVLMWGFGWPATAWPPTMWHAHEMLFGFVAAPIAGFLLTAVPSWTGQRGFGGTPLVLLVLSWVAARVLIATSTQWPAALVATVDVGFLVALGVLVAPPLLRSRNANTPLLLVLAGLAACNASTHWALAHRDAGMAYHAILVGIDITLLLVTVIGGRIVPAFTRNALRTAHAEVTLSSWPWITPAAIVTMVAVMLVDLLWLNSTLAGVVAGIA